MARSRSGTWGIRSYIFAIYGAAIFMLASLSTVFAMGDLREAEMRGQREAIQAADAAAASLNGAIDETLAYFGDGIDELAKIVVGLNCRFPANSEDETDILDYSTFHAFGPDGGVTCSSSDTALRSGRVYVTYPWFERARGGTVVSDLFRDPITDRSVFVIAGPVSGPETSVLAAVFPVDSIASRLASQDAVQHLSASVTILSTGSNQLVSASMQDAPFGLGRAPAVGATETWFDGQERIFGVADVGRFGWRVYVGALSSVVTAAAWDGIRHSTAVILSGLFVAMVATVIVYRKIVKPLRRLHSSIERTRETDEPEVVAVDGPAEIRTVAAGYNSVMKRRIELEERMSRAAFEDELTGLGTRAYLTSNLEDMISSRRPGDHPALLMLSLDRLSHARDTFGQETADALLIEAARRLQRATPDSALLARVGEASFAIFVREVSSTEKLVELCSGILHAVSRPFEVRGGSIEAGARIGIAGSVTATSGDRMLGDANAALAEARRTGQPFRFYDSQLRKRTEHDARIEQELHAAIEEHQLILHYQPIVDLDDLRVVGVEALVRWQHPEDGLRSPDEFLPIAERTGMMARLDRYIVAQVVRQAAIWNNDGHALSVSVNLSPQGLWEGETGMAIEHALAFHNLPPELLTVELTEGSLIGDSQVVRDTMASLKRLGVSLSVDDFGTGYSSLSYLKRFPIDQLKIDRSFVQGLGSADGQALTAAIVGIADAMRMRVVAEGVETEQQAVALRRLQCLRTQGFLFGRPVPADQIVRTAEPERRKLEVVRPA